MRKILIKNYEGFTWKGIGGAFLINLKQNFLYVFLMQLFQNFLIKLYLMHDCNTKLKNHFYTLLLHSSHIFIFKILKLENTRASEIFIEIPYTVCPSDILKLQMTHTHKSIRKVKVEIQRVRTLLEF